MPAQPKYETRPQARRRNRVAEISAVSDAMGFPLLEWQARSLRAATEYRVRDQVPYRKTALTYIGRQQGKSVLLSAVVVEAMLRAPGIFGVLTAQTRIAARNRLLDVANRAARSGLDPGLKLTKGVGNERVEWSNGSRLEVMSPTASSVHGESVDIAIIDEAWAVDKSVLSGIVPAMVARPRSQMWVISTAGTDDSELLNQMVDQAREDPQGPIAFTEYSMPDDAQPYDRDRWEEWMPALGVTQTYQAIEAAQSVLSVPEWARAFGNVRITEKASAAIPGDWWLRSVADEVPEIGLCLAVDVNRTPPGWAIAAAWDRSDPAGYHADLVHHHMGLELAPIIPKMTELVERFKPAAIGLDPIGPAGALLPDFQKLADDYAIPLRTFTGRERAQADVFLLELLRDESFTHSDLLPLRAAAEGATAEQRADVWWFSRKTSYVDLSPLLATSMAIWCAKEDAVLAPVFAIY